MSCNVSFAVEHLKRCLAWGNNGYGYKMLEDEIEPICQAVADHIKREALDDWTSSREEIRDIFYDRFLRTVDTPDTEIASHHE